jgi:hypothetical protein
MLYGMKYEFSNDAVEEEDLRWEQASCDSVFEITDNSKNWMKTVNFCSFVEIYGVESHFFYVSNIDIPVF